MKRTLLAATAVSLLSTPPAQGASSAEATFDSFSSEFRTSAAAEASSFLSRSGTTKEAEALSSFNSFEPKGLYFIIK